MGIQRQSYHGDYACSFGGAAMSDTVRTNSCTEVPTVRHAWVPAAMSYHATHYMSLLLEVLAPVVPTRY
jgi:hypothetical protein